MGSDAVEASAGMGTGLAPYAGRGERRASPRYQLVADFDLYQLRGAKHRTWLGRGQTRNWSRSSILITWDKPLEAGSSVELVVQWSASVKMIVVGRVLTTAERGTVIRILRGRFRAGR